MTLLSPDGFDLVLATLVYCAISGLVPVVNAEIYLLTVSAGVAGAPLVLVALAAAAGQTAAKTAIFVCGSGAARLLGRRRRDQLECARAQAERWKRKPYLVLLASATLGVPPLFAVSALAGALRFPVRRFVGVCFAGRLVRFAFFLALPHLAGIQEAHAEPKPAWEGGLGALALSHPQYTGSSDRSERLLPFPYFVYRGERLRANDGGMNVALLRRLELDVSFGAEPPVDADQGDLRKGMPDLLPSPEAGPSLDLLLLASEDEVATVKLRLAGRAALASDLRRWKWLGLMFAPELRLGAADRDRTWSSTLSMGPLFAQEAVYDYRYEVSQQMAMEGRPTYDAAGGFGGLRFLLKAGRRQGPVWLGLLVRYDNLEGAVFADSPLVRSQHALSTGLAVVWVFAESSRHAPSSD
jgi:membrane protein YqaA with SNARE-associated domain/outer membrane scaffolding protein for murein synthesis (MipA/OmpV family)